jgi:hypothetical protein
MPGNIASHQVYFFTEYVNGVPHRERHALISTEAKAALLQLHLAEISQLRYPANNAEQKIGAETGAYFFKM